MASLGTATLTTMPSILAASSYSPASGSVLGTAILLDLTGEGGAAVDPKRLLLVGSTWVPIQ